LEKDKIYETTHVVTRVRDLFCSYVYKSDSLLISVMQAGVEVYTLLQTRKFFKYKTVDQNTAVQHNSRKFCME